MKQKLSHPGHRLQVKFKLKNVQQFKSNKLNVTIDFSETLGSKVSRRAYSQMGAKREPKHISVSEVETFTFKLVHES